MSKLYDKVKSQCKDMGLSEKYLQTLTEALGGSLKEDSTDEEIDAVANQCVAVAKNTQAEATRWASKKKSKNDDAEDSENNRHGDEDDANGEPEWFRKYREAQEERIKAMEEAEEERKAAEAKTKRHNDIIAACDKYKVPEEKRRFVLNIPEDEDIDKYVGDYAKQVVVNELPLGQGGQKKVPATKETEDVGKGWFARFNPNKQ